MSGKGKTGRRDVRGLGQDEVRRLLEAARERGARDFLLLALTYQYGLRVTEAVTLPAGAVDVERMAVTVTGAKHGLTRTYPVPRWLQRAVRDWRPVGETFLHGRQGPLTRARAWQIFKVCGVAAGVDLTAIGIHSLRHSCAMHALDVPGITTEDVRDLLRHRRLSSSDVYANLSPKRRASYLERLEAGSAMAAGV